MNYITVLLCISMSQMCHAISGDGNVTMEKRMVTEFHRLTINGPFKIIFSNDPHGDFFVKTETDKNLQQYLTVTQRHDEVSINVKPGVAIDRFTRMTLYIDNNDISSLTINSNSAEESNLIMPVTCYESHLKITGSIPISIQIHVTCHQVTHVKDPAHDKIDHAKLIAEINNSRSTVLSGDIEEADIINNGNGEISAYALHADLLKVINNTKAAVEVYSDRDFKLNNSGPGHIYYKGKGIVSELKETESGSVCREEYMPVKTLSLKPETPMPKTQVEGFNTDSLFEEIALRDQRHRRNLKQGDTLHTSEDDAENFVRLKWYLDRYGYPEFNNEELNGMVAAVIDHIDNYNNFMQMKEYLLKAVQDGKLKPNTYAYAYDRSLIAAHMKPLYYYFLRGSEWDKEYKPAPQELEEINKQRKIINLPPYPQLLNGKYF